MKLTRKFPKTIMQELADGFAPRGYEILCDVLANHGRWSVGHSLIFKFDGKYYQSYYRVGATEHQDESPYEYDSAEIECEEVRPVERLSVFYDPVEI